MIEPSKIYNLLIESGIDLFTGVPDSLLKDICAYISDTTPADKNIIAANEGAAVAIAAGHYLATGNIAMVYMQNSGIGNAVNPLLSLADEKVYQIPMLLLIGWRGEPGVKDEPQHVKQGEVSLDLLEAMQIPTVVIDADESIATVQFQQLIADIKATRCPHAAVIRKNTFHPYKLQNKPENHFEMSREEALQIVVDSLLPEDVIVSTTGKLSRELFEYREQTGSGHDKDFLTVGSMGHSSSIALGIALSASNKKVYCLDGDGAFIMHTGAITSIGTLKPANYKHIVFNNGAHESVGAQPTVAFQLNLPQIALSCGYQSARTVATAAELKNALSHFRAETGPSFLEIKVNIQSREDLGRPTRTTYENKTDFMKNFK